MFDKIKDMNRLWLLMWHFTRPNRPTSDSVPSWQDEISRFELISYLVHQKHFCEDWRATLLRWYYLLSKKHPTKTTEVGTRHSKIQWKMADDIIDKALKKEYLLIAHIASAHPTSSEVFLTTDWRGRNFIRPLQFFKACLEEYDPIIRFLLGGGIGILATIIYNIWS